MYIMCFRHVLNIAKKQIIWKRLRRTYKHKCIVHVELNRCLLWNYGVHTCPEIWKCKTVCSVIERGNYHCPNLSWWHFARKSPFWKHVHRSSRPFCSFREIYNLIRFCACSPFWKVYRFGHTILNNYSDIQTIVHIYNYMYHLNSNNSRLQLLIYPMSENIVSVINLARIE